MIGKANVSGVAGEPQAAIIVSYTAGASCRCSNGTMNLYAPDTSGSAVFFVPSLGTWTIYLNGVQKRSVSLTTEGQSTSVTVST